MIQYIFVTLMKNFSNITGPPKKVLHDTKFTLAGYALHNNNDLGMS